jgi:hypothetical protein
MLAPLAPGTCRSMADRKPCTQPQFHRPALDHGRATAVAPGGDGRARLRLDLLLA